MKSDFLSPDKVLVPAEELVSNEHILRIYYRVFQKGYGGVLPPVVVIKPNAITHQHLQERKEQLLSRLSGEAKKSACGFVVNPYGYGELALSAAMKRVADLWNALEEKIRQAEYYLLDGNHRSLAAALSGRLIPAVEVKSDEDVAIMYDLVKQGELFPFSRRETTLASLTESFEQHCLQHIESVKTVRERAEKLVSEGKLPDYMSRGFR